MATLPRPPSIRSIELRRQVLDKSAPQSKTVPNPYLELLGDALARLLSLLVLHHCKPSKPASVLSRQRILFESNQWMAYLARHTGLTEMVNSSTDPKAKNAVSVGRKSAADLFERYMGALFVEQGLGVVSSWYYKLHEPMLRNIQSLMARLLCLREHDGGEALSEFYELSLKKISPKRWRARLYLRSNKRLLVEATAKSREKALRTTLDRESDALRNMYAQFSQDKSEEVFHVSDFAPPPPPEEEQNLTSLLLQTQKEISKATAVLQELRSETRNHELAIQSRMCLSDADIARPEDLEVPNQGLDILDFDSYFTESNAARRINSDNSVRHPVSTTQLQGMQDDLGFILEDMGPDKNN